MGADGTLSRRVGKPVLVFYRPVLNSESVGITASPSHLQLGGARNRDWLNAPDYASDDCDDVSLASAKTRERL